MGLIKAGIGTLGGTLADQWKEFFYCESMPKEVLVTKGQKRVSGRSSNTKGNDNIISNGSGIAVADGQCMIIVEQGKIVEVCAEPGEFTYDTSTEPSIFSGNLGESIKETFKTIGKRFTYGGDTGKDQRVYYSRPKKDGVVTDYYNYKCPTNIELGDTACSKKSIRADDLDKIVLSVIRKQMDIFLDTQKTLLGLIALEKEKAKHTVPANRVKELQDKLDQKKKLFSRLYIDFKDGILTQREYLLARDVYQKEIAAYESELQKIQAIKTKTKVTETGARKWNRLISRYYKAETVTEKMVEAMVDEIRVNTDGSLDIRFKYLPEFEEMFKECERIRKEVA